MATVQKELIQVIKSIQFLILKITSGSTPAIRDLVDNLYKEIVKVGTHKASSIKIAEAAKVIENTQRDLNIALINELSIIFNKMNIETKEVLDAAASNWNTLPFQPGLVGGHCIGVDPYYLTFKSKNIGYNPKIILAGRKLNDNMGNYVCKQINHGYEKKNIKINKSKILVMGLTFKENCSDIRNSGVKKVIKTLKKIIVRLTFMILGLIEMKLKKMYKMKPVNRLAKKIMMEL